MAERKSNRLNCPTCRGGVRFYGPKRLLDDGGVQRSFVCTRGHKYFTRETYFVPDVTRDRKYPIVQRTRTPPRGKVSEGQRFILWSRAQGYNYEDLERISAQLSGLSVSKYYRIRKVAREAAQDRRVNPMRVYEEYGCLSLRERWMLGMLENTNGGQAGDHPAVAGRGEALGDREGDGGDAGVHLEGEERVQESRSAA